jgi:hypothetical protein
MQQHQHYSITAELAQAGLSALNFFRAIKFVQ